MQNILEGSSIVLVCRVINLSMHHTVIVTKVAVKKGFPMLRVTNLSMHHIVSVAKVQHKGGKKCASAVSVGKRLVESESHSPSVWGHLASL